MLKQENLSFESQFYVDLDIKLEVHDPLLTELEQINYPLSPLQNSFVTEKFYEFLPITQSLKKENDALDLTNFPLGNVSSFKHGALTQSTTLFPRALDSFSIEEKFNLKPCYVLINRIESFFNTKSEEETRYACDNWQRPSFKEHLQKTRSSQRVSNIKASYSNSNLEIMPTFNHQRKCISYKDKSSENAHFHLNDKRIKYSCNLCNKSFLKKDNLNIHICSHLNKEEIRYTCDRCDKSYSRKGTLQYHIRYLCFPEKNCEFCTLLFANQTSLNKHLIPVHKNKVKHWQCRDCGKFFLNNGGHSQMKQSRKQSFFSCKLCEESFQSKCCLREHCFNYHGGRYVCKICNKIITDYCNYYRHLRKVHDEHRGKSRGGKQREKKHMCNICGEWLRGSSMKTHQKRQHLNDPRPEHFRKLMNKHRYLQNQKLLQLNIKLFKCEDCEALFKNKCHLNRHHKIHKGIKFSCELCGQKFADSSNLRKHLLRQHNLKNIPRIKTTTYKK